MSTPREAGPSTKDTEKKSGFGKQFITRVKTFVKRGDGSKRFSVISSKGKDKASAPVSAPVPDTSAAEEKTAAVPEGAVSVPRAQIYEERARKLGERFGLEIPKSEWHSTGGNALRVEKPIRMRDRRTCHKCNTMFGAARECPNCEHVRCTKCGRHPPHRSEEEKAASRAKRAAALKAQKENPPIVPDYRFHDQKDEIVLKRPRKAGEDLIYKKPRQRIRRNCHECSTLFVTGSKNCEKCGHVRCSDCPRDPPKKDKYPFGYPGDTFGPNAVPYHECHKCKTLFPPNPSDDAVCSTCQHQKCESCRRLSPRRVEPQPDPDVLKRVEEKLAALKLNPAPS